MNNDKNIELDMDSMRAAWQRLAVDAPTDERVQKNASMQWHAAKMMRHQLAMCIVCLVWAVISIPVMCFTSGHFLPLACGVYMSIYFVVMGAMCLRGYFTMKSVDPCRMSVRQCMGAVVRVKKVRLESRATGLTLAIPLLVYMLWHFYMVDEATFIGGVVGLVAGLAIGLSADIKMRRHIQSMEDYLKELDR